MRMVVVFPGTIGPEKSDDLAFDDFEGDLVNGSRARISFGKVFDSNHKQLFQQ